LNHIDKALSEPVIKTEKDVSYIGKLSGLVELTEQERLQV